MKSIIIDSTDAHLRLVAINDEKMIKYCGKENSLKHNAVLLENIDEILKNVSMSIHDVSTIGIVVGPGSFTGIRIGVATANAIGFATHANIIQMTSLEIIAYQVIETDRLALLDCKHDNFYTLRVENGNYEYITLTKEEVDAYEGFKMYADESYIDNMINVFNKKRLRKIFIGKAEPFYIKKSSAENA